MSKTTNKFSPELRAPRRADEIAAAASACLSVHPYSGLGACSLCRLGACHVDPCLLWRSVADAGMVHEDIDQLMNCSRDQLISVRHQAHGMWCEFSIHHATFSSVEWILNAG